MTALQGIESGFAIELASQSVFPLAELSDHAPRRRRGKKLNIATAYRWSNGVLAKDGTCVKLPTIQVGGTRCTSVEAFQWFCERLGTPNGDSRSATYPSRGRRKAADRAERELDTVGI
jgi:hypothetical protein